MIPKIVFDTNVYIAATLNPGGFADNLLDRAVRGTYELYVSADILNELKAKLVGKFKLSETQVARVIEKIIQISTLVYPVHMAQSSELRDKKDLHILACAVEATADLIITSDKDLLSLKHFQTIKIAHPSQMKFWYT